MSSCHASTPHQACSTRGVRVRQKKRTAVPSNKACLGQHIHQNHSLRLHLHICTWLQWTRCPNRGHATAQWHSIIVQHAVQPQEPLSVWHRLSVCSHSIRNRFATIVVWHGHKHPHQSVDSLGSSLIVASLPLTHVCYIHRVGEDLDRCQGLVALRPQCLPARNKHFGWSQEPNKTTKTGFCVPQYWAYTGGATTPSGTAIVHPMMLAEAYLDPTSQNAFSSGKLGQFHWSRHLRNHRSAVLVGDCQAERSRWSHRSLPTKAPFQRGVPHLPCNNPAPLVHDTSLQDLCLKSAVRNQRTESTMVSFLKSNPHKYLHHVKTGFWKIPKIGGPLRKVMIFMWNKRGYYLSVGRTIALKKFYNYHFFSVSNIVKLLLRVGKCRFPFRAHLTLVCCLTLLVNTSALQNRALLQNCAFFREKITIQTVKRPKWL